MQFRSVFEEEKYLNCSWPRDLTDVSNYPCGWIPLEFNQAFFIRMTLKAVALCKRGLVPGLSFASLPSGLNDAQQGCIF